LYFFTNFLIELIKTKEVDYACILDGKKNRILDFDILVTQGAGSVSNICQIIKNQWET